MARNWTVPFDGGRVSYPSSGSATQSVVPTTLAECDSFDAGTDQSVILPFTVPAEHTGSGTLKLRMLVCANTTTATDDARIDVVTEFRTPAAAEAMNSDAFDATPDSATVTFSTTAYSLQELIITLTPATTPAAGDRARIKVTRDADHATDDSLASALLVLSYEVYEEA